MLQVIVHSSADSYGVAERGLPGLNTGAEVV